MVFHMMLAAKNPEFMLTEPEAKQLAEAIANYLRHSKVAVDPKTRDLGMLLFVAATIEGPRIIGMVNRHADERKRQRQVAAEQAGANVMPLNPAYRMPGL